MVALIALLPAICVLLVAIVTQSKGSTIVAAVIAALIGLAGGPAYTALDLICVGVATAIAFVTVLSTKLSDLEKDKRDRELQEFQKKLDAFQVGIFKIAAVGIVIFAIYSWNEMTRSVPQKVAQHPAPAVSTYTSSAEWAVPAAPQSSRDTTPEKLVHHKTVAKTPLQKCLSIRDEGKMMDCLSNTP
jgi:hypothetical protein